MELFDENVLIKVGLFALVQALVYLILSKSSNVFSKTQRSYSFKTARSVSIRRMAAALADLPAGGEPSPTSKDLTSSKSFK
ncbi:hypothetical protein CQW23_02510 [Capsicum baccatum]|uniref:Uncharacterized protein n=2 Tax=Capsicum TaxID=4071 RepID=A0A1U8E6J1_CAPAN|nr:uncharacterized protein LOC107843169 [Capsicum annuum]PHT60147.1 hypothetical protein CQW23_02510 [Capsicum baccatum]PHU30705.1 hypothetical protein BC332_02798 [Capsicum chinense]KAF3617008.1 putative cyclic pyranopterin monophosphate synthase, mitochondrial-like isoform X1 [Capsicum annuum]KAF3632314.1 putative cyclic pyranopterin monophosphate synthase, mitochondrial-like isoform X1 [Capsicum annuum]PHT95138.1 hypothetical protein T459_03020 [Capsicum annuum]